MFYLPPEPSTIERLGAEVMAVGQPGGNLDFLTDDAGWQSPPTPSALWTDERSDVISRIRWR